MISLQSLKFIFRFQDEPRNKIWILSYCLRIYYPITYKYYKNNEKKNIVKNKE